MNSDKLLQKLIEDYWFNKFLLAEKSVVQSTAGNFKTASTKINDTDLVDFLSITNDTAMGEFIVLMASFSVLIRKYFFHETNLVYSSALNLYSDNPVNENPFFYLFDFNTDESFKAIINKIKLEVERTVNHKAYSYHELKNEFPDKGIVETDLFRYGFNYSKVNGNQKTLQKSGFGLSINKEHEGFNISLTYDTDLYDPHLASQFVDHYAFLLKRIKASLAVEFKNITLLSEEEIDTITNVFNSHPSADVKETSLLKMFAVQVNANPDKIALQLGDIKYTYHQLDEKTDQLAAFLLNEYKIVNDQLIGIIATKTEWAIIGIISILKAGGAFVPIEPNQPVNRIQQIIKDAGINILLLETDQMFDFEWFTGNIVVTDIQTDTFTFDRPVINPVSDNESLAYVIYTSGTTGSPKGVMVNCSSVANYASWLIKKFQLSARDSSVILASLAFDLGYTSLWGTLLSGGTLHLVPFDYGSAPDKILAYLAENNISFIKTTPSLFYMLTHVPHFKINAHDLAMRLIILGGEMIRKDDVENYKIYHPLTVFVNHYGPTEATIGCITNTLNDDLFIDSYSTAPIIGKPIENCEVLIIDQNENLMPVGLEGELHIGGKSIARGYLNQLELTEAKFIKHPYRTGERLYKTGDFGKWTPDGKIILNGRKDNQVKIRGHRVELGEIEQQLLKYQFISNVIVIADTNINGDKNIIAYYKPIQIIDESDLRTFITASLPSHMVPEYFIEIDQVPLTANGKIDYKKLPSLNFFTTKLNGEHVPPRNEVENIILSAWKETLGKKVISVKTNFFDIGGNSLYLIKVSSILAEPFPELSIVDLFNYTTIEKLALFISEKNDAEIIEITEGTIKLSARYFTENSNNAEKSDFKFELKDNLLNEIRNVALFEEVSVNEILSAMFAYSLYEVSEQKDITLHSIKNAADGLGLSAVKADFEKIHDPSSLFKSFTGSFKDLNTLYSIPLIKIKNLKFTDRGTKDIAPLIYTKDIARSRELLPDVFDLFLEIDDTDAEVIKCTFEYKALFEPSLMESFINAYINNLSGLLKAEE